MYCWRRRWEMPAAASLWPLWEEAHGVVRIDFCMIPGQGGGGWGGTGGDLKALKWGLVWRNSTAEEIDQHRPNTWAKQLKEGSVPFHDTISAVLVAVLEFSDSASVERLRKDRWWAHKAETAYLMLDKKIKMERTEARPPSELQITPITYFLLLGCLPQGGQGTILWILRIELWSSDSCSRHISHWDKPLLFIEEMETQGVKWAAGGLQTDFLWWTAISWPLTRAFVLHTAAYQGTNSFFPKKKVGF